MFEWCQLLETWAAFGSIDPLPWRHAAALPRANWLLLHGYASLGSHVSINHLHRAQFELPSSARADKTPAGCDRPRLEPECGSHLPVPGHQLLEPAELSRVWGAPTDREFLTKPVFLPGVAKPPLWSCQQASPALPGSKRTDTLLLVGSDPIAHNAGRVPTLYAWSRRSLDLPHESRKYGELGQLEKVRFG